MLLAGHFCLQGLLQCEAQEESWHLCMESRLQSIPADLLCVLQQALASGGRFAGDPAETHESKPSVSGNKAPAFPNAGQAPGSNLALSAAVRPDTMTPNQVLLHTCVPSAFCIL